MLDEPTSVITLPSGQARAVLAKAAPRSTATRPEVASLLSLRNEIATGTLSQQTVELMSTAMAAMEKELEEALASKIQAGERGRHASTLLAGTTEVSSRE